MQCNSLLDLSNYVEKSRLFFEQDLQELVNIPSVSMDPAHGADIDSIAKAAAKLLIKIGAEVELIATPGNPVVYGEINSSPSCPSVVVYNHLDVQPVEPSEWKSPPFKMKIDNGVYVGRGTTDDKGPALCIMYAAKYIKENKIPINIKFIWELEEEIGSPNFETFLGRNRARLQSDSIVVSDTIWVSRESPAIGYGLRGLQGFLLKLVTGVKDVHSGVTGGLARNPISELAVLISECYDATNGKVKIPGFYDDVKEVSPDELDNFAKSGFTVAGFRQAHALKLLRPSDDREAALRIWGMPTFEVHGIVGGYVGPGIKTIVPHKAEAKVSMRLVPNQDPKKIFELVTNFVKSKNPDVEIVPEGSLMPYLGDYASPYAQAAYQAMKEAFCKEPSFVREGGSIGAVVSMQKVLNVPIVLLGLSLPEHGYHAINENFDWEQAAGGILMFIRYFSMLARMR